MGLTIRLQWPGEEALLVGIQPLHGEKNLRDLGTDSSLLSNSLLVVTVRDWGKAGPWQTAWVDEGCTILADLRNAKFSR